MKFTETALKGAFVVEIEPVEDERGFFARSWCQKEFAMRGLNANLLQCNLSFNNKKGTLRGMHFQGEPHPEVKLVRCTMGKIYDVIVDLRSDSLTYKRWFATELSAENRKALYVPQGCAHGFQTLVDNTEVYYQMSEVYFPELACGVRYDDPAFSIIWPIDTPILSDRDKGFAWWVDKG